MCFLTAVKLTIESLGPRGDGKATHEDGRSVYIDRTAPGDVVEARVASAPDGTMRGEVQAILTPGPDRVAPPCPHYDICGGCTLQHLAPAAQRTWKQNLARTAMARQEVEVAHWHKPVFIDEGTRRRATFAVFRQKDRILIGYHARRSRRIAGIQSCMVLDPALMVLRERMAPYLASIFRDSQPSDVSVQKVGSAFDIVLTGPVGRKGSPDLNVREAAAQMAGTLGLARLSWRADARDMPEPLLSLQPVTARFGTLAVDLPPGAFLQPSAQGESALVNAVLSALPERGPFADLFAGCGTFTGPMRERGAVDAFECDPGAVEALARAGKGQGVQARRRDLFHAPLSARELECYTAIVMDPPRAGARAQAREIALSHVPIVVSVSCNPATFARDAAILCGGGYRLQSVQIIDQFAFSHHLELVGVFHKAGTPAKSKA